MDNFTRIREDHPSQRPPPVVYLDTEGKPWRRIQNLNSATQSSYEFERYSIPEALTLIGLGVAKARKSVYP